MSSGSPKAYSQSYVRKQPLSPNYYLLDHGYLDENVVDLGVPLLVYVMHWLVYIDRFFHVIKGSKFGMGVMN